MSSPFVKYADAPALEKIINNKFTTSLFSLFKPVRLLAVIALAFTLSACGGGSGGSGGTTDTTTTYTVGGNVSGLAGTFVLQSNGGDDLTITADGAFTFATALADGATYAATVSTQPSGQTCTVTNGSGTISGANIADVSVTCITAGSGYTVGGNVSGLVGGETVVLQNNGGDDLTMTGNDNFTFTEQADGATYAVTVSTQPSGQTCTVTNAYGTISGANVADVSVTCADNGGGGGDATAPVITLLGSSPIDAEAGSVYADAGATAVDNVDGDITASIVVGGGTVNTAVVGTYVITYDVTDLAGNPATQVTRTVNVVDTTAPVITLNGSNPMSVEIGGVYTEPGAIAVDNADGDITSSIVIGGDTVNNAVGAYVITYDVTDLAGNPAIQVTRTVNVVPAIKAFYPANGANWNDYVKNDNTTQFDASDIAADGSETGGYSAVIHGGELRSVDIGVASCTDQAATDALEAFDWVCDDSTGGALIVSTGLKEGKNLSDLLDFDALAWKPNSVTVTGTDAGLPFTTASTAWWSNAITQDNDGGSLATSGSVYVVTSNPFAAYTMDADKVALVIKPGVTLYGSGTDSDTIYAGTQNFLWVEGAIDATGDDYGVYWSAVGFSVIRNMRASTAGSAGVSLRSSSDNNSLSNVTVANNASSGVYLRSSSGNSLLNVTASNNVTAGVYLYDSSDNSMSYITAANNVYYGIFLQASSNNSLSNVTAANNGGYGVNIRGSSDNSLSNVTAANNGDYGVLLYSSSNDNSLLNITVANNGLVGVNLQSSSNNNSLSSITAVNNGIFGIDLDNSSNNSLSNVTAANHSYGVYLNSSSNNYFTGILKVGNNSTNDCYEFGGTNPGLEDATCANNGTSDATLTSGITLASSFVGKVTTDDAANADDTNGTADYPADPSAFDWTSFENIYRNWGIDGSAFPNADHQGEWASGDGVIWDWSLVSGDTGDAGGPVIQSVLTALLVGESANSITHAWSDASTVTYLRNAVEIAGMGGNDNGLCETDETCLYTPNIGSYQGHGALESAGAFTDGASITGVTLMQYSTNGY